MLVPPLISLPVSHRGTDENASPGVTMSGFASSPPRELHQPTTSAAGGAPPCAGRANAPGKTAPTDSARSAEPGKPTVDSPGLSGLGRSGAVGGGRLPRRDRKSTL